MEHEYTEGKDSCLKAERCRYPIECLSRKGALLIHRCGGPPSPLGKAKIRFPQYHVCRQQTSPFQRNNIPRARIAGTYHFTNPLVFVRERPKTGAFQHTERGDAFSRIKSAISMKNLLNLYPVFCDYFTNKTLGYGLNFPLNHGILIETPLG